MISYGSERIRDYPFATSCTPKRLRNSPFGKRYEYTVIRNRPFAIRWSTKNTGLSV